MTNSPLRLSDKIPSEAEYKALTVDSFIGAVQRLAGTHLVGLVELEVTGGGTDTVTINPEYTAVLIREILKSTGIDRCIKIRISMGDELLLQFIPNTSPSQKELMRIESIARAAGFKPFRSDRALSYKVKLDDKATMKLYAISENELYYTLCNYILSYI